MSDRPLPPELNQPLPRCVKPSNSFKLMTAIVTIGFLGLGLYLIGTAFKMCHDQAILKTTGVETNAAISNLSLEYGRHGSIHYRISYQFQPVATIGTAAPPQWASRLTSKENYQNLQIGQSVPILYDPLNPDRSDLNINDVLHKADPYRAMPVLTEIIGGIFGGSYIFVMSFTLFAYFREKKLVQFGSATPATIIKEEEVDGRRPSLSVTYQFTDSWTAVVEAVQKNLPSKAQLKTKRFRKFYDSVMENPTALYDPQDSDKSMLYPSSYVVCYLPKTVK